MSNHVVIETPDFIMECRECEITSDERTAIVSHFSRIPKDGLMIKRTGGARKVRFGGRGKGKSGGYRMISYFGGDDIPVFLLNVFAKGDKVDLSKTERNELRKELEGLAEDYRRGVRLNVESG